SGGRGGRCSGETPAFWRAPVFSGGRKIPPPEGAPPRGRTKGRPPLGAPPPRRWPPAMAILTCYGFPPTCHCALYVSFCALRAGPFAASPAGRGPLDRCG